MNGRRARRNLLTAAAVSASLWTVFTIAAKDSTIEGLSFATAYVAVGLLAASLSLGPLNLIRGRPNPVSTHLRRDVGIWAAAIAFAHTFLGLQVHMAGRLSAYFVYRRPADMSMVDALTVFVTSNYMGALATILLAVLLSLSSDFALRRAGTRRWKSLQRLSYALSVLIVLHGLSYQLLEKRRVEAMVLFGTLIVSVVVLQMRGSSIYRRSKARDQRHPG